AARPRLPRRRRPARAAGLADPRRPRGPAAAVPPDRTDGHAARRRRAARGGGRPRGHVGHARGVARHDPRLPRHARRDPRGRVGGAPRGRVHRTPHEVGGTSMATARVTRTLDVPAATLWKLVAAFGDTSWLPGPPKVELVGSGPGMERRIQGPDKVIRERLESVDARSEEHTSELQSLTNLVCRLLLEKKKHGPP